MVMCRPNSASNGDGAKSATSTMCNACAGAISSHAAGRPMLLGRAIGRQPSAPAKKASARRTSRVARVRWASDTAPPRGIWCSVAGRQLSPKRQRGMRVPSLARASGLTGGPQPNANSLEVRPRGVVVQQVVRRDPVLGGVAGHELPGNAVRPRVRVQPDLAADVVHLVPPGPADAGDVEAVDGLLLMVVAHLAEDAQL